MTKTSFTIRIALVLVLGAALGVNAFGQGPEGMTPIQQRIAQQKQRLSSSDAEERRDALMKLGALKHPEASRAAVASLNDADPMVRVTAAHAISMLPDAVNMLLPLLKDKAEFVRREIANALGETRSGSAVQPLVDLLTTEKEISVRAAAVLALGRIGNESAVPALTQTLSGLSPNKKSKKREDDFVIRSAAKALGLIGSRAGVAPLVAVLTTETNSIDLRRTAAESLGLIGDPSATPALESAVASSDPYLADEARIALRRVRLARK